MYSIVVWLNPPHEYPVPGQSADSEGHHPPGNRPHVFNPPAATRLAYGHYPDREEAEMVLASIERDLTDNIPIRIVHDNGQATIFSIPPDSVYYIVLARANK